MPLVRFPTPTGLVYTIDLRKIADRANPRTVEAPISAVSGLKPTVIDWGDGTSETVTAASGSYPTHTYAEGAGDVFQVVMRNETGNFRPIRFKKTANSTIEQNIELACVSVDHFTGVQESISGTFSQHSMFRACANVRYVDPRVVASTSVTDSGYLLYNCENLDQPIESFYFGLMPYLTSLFTAFYGCRKIHGAPRADMLDGCYSIANLTQTFQNCVSLTSPFVFWKDDGTLDTDRFPSLSTAPNCYYGCTADLRAQVPTDYGGTMTVS